MALHYQNGTSLSFQQVMFAFEDMVTGSSIITMNSRAYRIEKNGQQNLFLGSGLTYDLINGNTVFTGGTITSIQFYDSNSVLLGSFAGLSLDATVLSDALLAEATGTDPFALENLFFNQDWSIIGVDGIDMVIDANQLSTDGLAFGFTGNDTAQFDNGNDYIDLGIGNDSISTGAGNDTLLGADGNDTLNGDDGEDFLYGGIGKDKLIGGTGNDSIFGGNGADNIRGQQGDDHINGENGSDVLRGGGGKDTLFGGRNDDRLFGGSGLDTLYGENHNDTLTGGEGNDDLFGGNGADVFIFATDDDIDVLWDFDASDDTITINEYAAFTDGVIDDETLVDGTEITVTTYGAAPITGLTGGYLITYGTGDVIYLEADVIL